MCLHLGPEHLILLCLQVQGSKVLPNVQLVLVHIHTGPYRIGSLDGCEVSPENDQYGPENQNQFDYYLQLVHRLQCSTGQIQAQNYL